MKKKISYKKVFLWTAFSFFSIIALGLLSLTIFISILSAQLPNIGNIDNLFLAESTSIYDREGNVLYVKHGGENRKYVKYEDISPHVINATISMEDDQFWNHPGFDIWGIGKAGLHEVFGIGAKRGGSTITQQYVKYAFLSLERSYIRKVKELILAVRLEKEYDKKKIIELYLNKIPYGNNAFGVEKAAFTYFAKHAKDLTIAESAVLAAILQAPSYYNPYGSHRYSTLRELDASEIKKRKIKKESDLSAEDISRGLIGSVVDLGENKKIYVHGRSDLVIRRMQELGYLTEKEKQEAWEQLQKLEFEKYSEPIKHPHVVMHVLTELEKKYGKEVVEQGGLEVWTTIDPKLQEAAEKAIEEGVKKNKQKFNATNASLVSIDNQTGELLAMVGSVDFYDEKIDGEVNVATSYRQPGSSFKPFVYAQAFYNRFAPASVVFDVATSFGGTKKVQNYDGRFMGPISMRKALGQSRNIPAIKAYFLAGEKDPILELTQKMGLKYKDTSIDYGWPLGLGTAEVRLYDMVQAYSVFANNGKKREIHIIKKITNSRGDVLEEVDTEEDTEEVLDPQIAYLITNILSDKTVRIGPRLGIPGFTNAGKTGTSTKEHPTNKQIRVPSNLWTIGFSKDITTGVWAGNSNDRKSGNLKLHANGYDAAAPIWQKYMIEAHKNRKNKEFPRPKGIKSVVISTITGKLPGRNTPSDMRREELFASFAVPTDVDNSYEEVRIDIATGKRATADCPEEFVEVRRFRNYQALDPNRKNWVSAIRSWAGGAEGFPPPLNDFACSVDKQPSIVITSPSTYSHQQPGNINVGVNYDAPLGVNRVEFFLDDRLVYTNTNHPYNGIVRLSDLYDNNSRHLIVAKIFDSAGLSAQSVIEFTVENVDTSSNEESQPQLLNIVEPNNKEGI